MHEPDDLLRLAESAFVDLNDAERTLFGLISFGRNIKFTEEKLDDIDLAASDSWGRDRVIRADRLKWLCMDPKASEFIPMRGVDLGGVKIEGILALELAILPFPVLFKKCVFSDTIRLLQAKIQGLSFNGSWTKSIIADGLTLDGGLYLRNGFSSSGQVSLLRATIGGNLDCGSASFTSDKTNSFAILADGIRVRDAVILTTASSGRGSWEVPGHFVANGEVRFLEATVGRAFYCDGAEFTNPGGIALNCDRIQIDSDMRLCAGFKALGEVRMINADVGGDLLCEGGSFTNPTGVAFRCGGARIRGNAYFRDQKYTAPDAKNIPFLIDGKAEFDNATIGRVLVWTGSKAGESVDLSLRNATVGILWDNFDAWPAKGKLHIDGFSYDRIDLWAPIDARRRIDWISRQPDNEYRRGPFE